MSLCLTGRSGDEILGIDAVVEDTFDINDVGLDELGVGEMFGIRDSDGDMGVFDEVEGILVDGNEAMLTDDDRSMYSDELCELEGDTDSERYDLSAVLHVSELVDMLAIEDRVGMCDAGDGIDDVTTNGNDAGCGI